MGQLQLATAKNSVVKKISAGLCQILPVLESKLLASGPSVRSNALQYSLSGDTMDFRLLSR
jgi:hypothetical protein